MYRNLRRRLPPFDSRLLANRSRSVRQLRRSNLRSGNSRSSSLKGSRPVQRMSRRDIESTRATNRSTTDARTLPEIVESPSGKSNGRRSRERERILVVADRKSVHRSDSTTVVRHALRLKPPQVQKRARCDLVVSSDG
jgi:hypothetical protein